MNCITAELSEELSKSDENEIKDEIRLTFLIFRGIMKFRVK